MLLAFALPALMQGFMYTPAWVALQGVYASEFGLPLAGLGTAILLARVFDAVTDPAIGLASDAWQRRYGTRKPFLWAGAPLTMLALVCLFNPPAGVDLRWFGGWFMATFLGWTLIEIPYRAWSLELSSDHGQRARIAAWLAASGFGGAALFYALPLAGQVLGLDTNAAISAQTLRVASVVALVGVPIGILLASGLVPDGPRLPERTTDSPHTLLRALFGNGPFVYVLGVYLAFGIALGMQASVLFFYVGHYLRLPDRLALVLLLSLPLSIVSAPLWGWLAGRMESHRAWALSLVVIAAGIGLIGLIPPGPDAFGWYLAGAGVVMFCATAGYVALPAMIGDINDYGIWKFGHDRAGTYFSVYTLLVKTVAGVGAAAGLALLDWFGFDATRTDLNGGAIVGLKLTYVWIPAAIILGVAPLIWRFPLTRARHAQIMRALRRRAAAADIPATGHGPPDSRAVRA
ncbi:MAG: MFS transporter [Sinimarinibacterium sp.]|jgi:Na+/melibiose symporter-like transporter